MEFHFDFISAVPFFSFNAPFITAKSSGEILIGKFPSPVRRWMRAAFTDIFPLNICVQSSRGILFLCAVRFVRCFSGSLPLHGAVHKKGRSSIGIALFCLFFFKSIRMILVPLPCGCDNFFKIIMLRIPAKYLSCLLA